VAVVGLSSRRDGVHDAVRCGAQRGQRSASRRRPGRQSMPARCGSSAACAASPTMPTDPDRSRRTKGDES